MGTRLKEYIYKRLKDPKTVSSVECDIIASIDSHKITGQVKVLYIEEDRFEIYSADINDKVSPARISISSQILEGTHDLKKALGDNPEIRRQRDSLFSYDPSTGKLIFDDYFTQYCDLESIFETINGLLIAAGIRQNDQIIIAKSVYWDKALLYMMERHTERIVMSSYNGEPVATRGRIEISNRIGISKVGIAYPMNTIIGLIFNRKDIYVPLDSATLDAEFYNGVSWRTLLGEIAEESEKDIIINGTHCRLVRLAPYVDAFGNVFIDVLSVIDKRSRHTLVASQCIDIKSTFDIVSTGISNSPSTPKSVNPPQEKSQIKPRQEKEGLNKRDQEESRPDKRATKKSVKYRQDTFMAEDTIVLFDGSVFNWKKTNEKIPSMSRQELVDSLKIINGVFETLSKSERIVTDTNLWVMEHSSKPGEMAYKELIEFILNKNKKLVYEILGVVYDEIYRLDQKKEAAANKAKTYINTQHRLGRIDFVEIKLGADKHAYADIPIGERVFKLYENDVKFSILTNDTDASTRWLAGLKEKQKDLNRESLPPLILCRELQTLFKMRGKVIAQLKQLNSQKQ